MRTAVVDASALVKCWVQEPGTAEIRAFLADAERGRLYVSTLTCVEVAATIVRAARGGRIGDSMAGGAVAEVRALARGPLNLLSLSAELMERAMDLAQTHGLRGADCVQLATACEVGEIQAAFERERVGLVAADQALLAAARQEGLDTWNPEEGPLPEG